MRPTGAPSISFARETAPATATATVLLFGRVADDLGRRVEIEIPATGCSLADLRRRLAALSAAAEEALAQAGVRAAIDQVICGDEAWVTPDQEIAFFSMFSGG